jgi:hypothetical protein
MTIPIHPKIADAFDRETDMLDWIALVTAAAEQIEASGATEDVVFHGTTENRARRILADGMRPTMAFEVSPDDEDEYRCRGSFWGRIEVAAWWAASAACNRGGHPVLIAIRTEDLAEQAVLGIDIPSRDFPQVDLSPFDDPTVAARWIVGEHPSWRDSLHDLGSLTAIHDGRIRMDSAMIFDTIESLHRILGNRSFSA